MDRPVPVGTDGIIQEGVKRRVGPCFELRCNAAWCVLDANAAWSSIFIFLFFVAVAPARAGQERKRCQRKRCQVFPFARGGLSRVNRIGLQAG